jgi:hypothetical protein
MPQQAARSSTERTRASKGRESEVLMRSRLLRAESRLPRRLAKK